MSDRPRVTLEVCVDDIEDAVAAQEAGADRIELCASLEQDGLSPGETAIRRAAARLSIPFVVMVRPRGGDFCYDAAEAESMERDIGVALSLGAAGVVFGALTPNDEIDLRLCTRLRSTAGNAQTVFHRAFDRLADPFRGLDQLVDMGITRVLTSGGGPCAADPICADRIARLINRAAGRIEILPGGGIRPHSAASLLAATNAASIHSSCRSDSKLDPAMVAELRRIIDLH